MASQKLGRAKPSVEKLRAPVSRLPPGRTPDRMPMGMPTMSDTMAEATTRPKVTGNRMAICWLTDWPVESEVPRFPRIAPKSQCQYWTIKGSLRCNCARTLAISAGVALTPPARVTAGSPGTSASKKKTAKETMSNTGIMLTRRRRINQPTRPPWQPFAVLLKSLTPWRCQRGSSYSRPRYRDGAAISPRRRCCVVRPDSRRLPVCLPTTSPQGSRQAAVSTLCCVECFTTV